MIRENATYTNEQDGIRSIGLAVTIIENSATFNGGDGIEATGGAIVQQNLVRGNTGFGLNLLSADVVYRENVIVANTGGTVTGGTARAANYCDVTPPGCP